MRVGGGPPAEQPQRSQGQMKSWNSPASVHSGCCAGGLEAVRAVLLLEEPATARSSWAMCLRAERMEGRRELRRESCRV